MFLYLLLLCWNLSIRDSRRVCGAPSSLCGARAHACDVYADDDGVYRHHPRLVLTMMSPKKKISVAIQGTRLPLPALECAVTRKRASELSTTRAL